MHADAFLIRLPCVKIVHALAAVHHQLHWLRRVGLHCGVGRWRTVPCVYVSCSDNIAGSIVLLMMYVLLWVITGCVDVLHIYVGER